MAVIDSMLCPFFKYIHQREKFIYVDVDIGCTGWPYSAYCQEKKKKKIEKWSVPDITLRAGR